MSNAPFFRDEPFLRDEPPDTSRDEPSVDTPLTRAMGPGEHFAMLDAEVTSGSVEILLRPDGLEAAFDLPTISLDDLGNDLPLDDFDEAERFDRKTLRSAPYPPAILDDSEATLTFDIPPAPLPSIPMPAEIASEPASDASPSEQTHAALPSSIWGKLQRFVTGISKPRSQPPISSASSRKISQRSIFDLAWTLDNAALDALSSHIDRILVMRHLGPEAYAESRVVDMLDAIADSDRNATEGVFIATLRSRIPEVARPMLDHALLRLENRGVVALLPDDPGYDGIMDPVRGHLNRCILLQQAH
jgi:hypothetical protein